MKNKKLYNLSLIPGSSKKLTEEKAYILGTLCGDGYITTGYRIGLDVCDKEFAEYFQKCLSGVYCLNPSIRKSFRKITNYCKNAQPRYKVMLVSKLTVLDLLSYSSSFKTFKWQVPIQIKEGSKKIKAKFIQGFDDSEGSVKNKHRNREMILCSGNYVGLKEIQNLMFEFGIKSYFSIRKNNVAISSTSDYKSLKLFHDKIGFIIRRKQEKLEAGIARYKRKGIRKYSMGIKNLALDMLRNDYTYQEIGKLLNTSYANVHDWKKAFLNPKYYKERWKRQKKIKNIA